MPVSAIRAAVKQTLAAGFTAYPVVYENETYNPPTQDGAWVMVEIFGGDYVQASLGVSPAGDNRWDERGLIMAHVFVQSGTGMDQTDAILGGLADLFRGVELAGGYEMQDMTTGPGQASDERGLWYRTTLTVDWIKR